MAIHSKTFQIKQTMLIFQINSRHIQSNIYILWTYVQEIKPMTLVLLASYFTNWGLLTGFFAQPVQRLLDHSFYSNQGKQMFNQRYEFQSVTECRPVSDGLSIQM